MLTNDLKHILKPRAVDEMRRVSSSLAAHDIRLTTIADVGANIGYYTEAILEVFDSATVHSYEPHPANLEFLRQLSSERLYIHPYGLYNDNTTLSIGMRDSRNNNGTFSIFNTHDSIEVQFRNANEEPIKPDFVKLDVEGSELFILQCGSFFEKTKAIFIELIYTDEFQQNTNVTNQLLSMGFTFSTQITKNDQLWLKL